MAEQDEKGDRCVAGEHAADAYTDPSTIPGAKISLACNGIGGIVLKIETQGLEPAKFRQTVSRAAPPLPRCDPPVQRHRREHGILWSLWPRFKATMVAPAF
jgi:hypothetical protein